MDTDFFTGDFSTNIVNHIEKFNEIFNATLPEVVGVYPKGAELFIVDDGLDCLADALDGPIVYVEPVEDDLEGVQFRALPEGIVEVFHEVLEHAFLVLREVSVAAALEGEFHEGRVADERVQCGHLMSEVAEVLRCEEIAVLLVALVELGYHQINLI